MPSIGYRSVTIHQDKYDVLKAIADQRKITGQKGASIMEVMEMLIEQYSRPYVRAIIDEIAASKPGFEAPYHAFVLDSSIKRYESTSWIRTEDYVKQMRDPMLLKIRDRILMDNELNVEKIFILSRESWDKKTVWQWIAEWLTYRFVREKQLRLFVIREKTADEMLSVKEKHNQKQRQDRFYDMGIYGLALERSDPWDTVGYLGINEKTSKPEEYTRVRRCDAEKEIKEAEKFFADLMKRAEAIFKTGDIEALQMQPYE